MTSLNPTLDSYIKESVRIALAEDIGTGDRTAALVPVEQQAKANVLVRDEALICGCDWFNEVFSQLSGEIQVNWAVAEGQRVQPDTNLCTLVGPARELLTGERTALNFLQTLSAVATMAQRFALAVQDTNATILDTRKTIPGLRLAQKYAVRTGGAANHRTGLYDGILIKENHIAAGGGISSTVAAALKAADGILVEVEVETIEEAREAIDAGAHRLLLDNFDLNGLYAAVLLRNETNSGVTLEASGGVSLESARQIAETGVDFISIGALTKDIHAIDLSMRFEMID